MSNTWFVVNNKTQLKCNQVDLTKSGMVLEPCDSELKFHNQKVPGSGLKAWFIRAFYYMRIFVVANVWFLDQLWSKHNSFKGKKIPKRSGDVAVVTGGARGIGTEIVRKLLIADMNIIIGCRDVVAGYKLIDRFRSEGHTTGVAECMFLDLENLVSVRDFARRVLEKHSAIHVLINNAGIMLAPFKLTDDGLESHFQINYLGHLKLSILLTPALAKGGSESKFSRIINVTSKAQILGEIDFKDLLMREMYSRSHAYNCTKLMQVVSSNYLDDKFKANGLKIHSHSAHPGLVYSELFKYQVLFRLFRPLFKLLMQNVEAGADCIVYTALSPDIESDGGMYFGNCKPETHHRQAIDKEIQQKLWDISCELIGVDSNVIEQSCMESNT